TRNNFLNVVHYVNKIRPFSARLLTACGNDTLECVFVPSSYSVHFLRRTTQTISACRSGPWVDLGSLTPSTTSRKLSETIREGEPDYGSGQTQNAKDRCCGDCHGRCAGPIWSADWKRRSHGFLRKGSHSHPL